MARTCPRFGIGNGVWGKHWQKSPKSKRRRNKRCRRPNKNHSKETNMPVQLDEQDGERILVVHVSGKLAKENYQRFVPEFERLVRQHGKPRVLFDMTGFHGWEAGALWDDIKFDVEHFADIERLAMIGEEKWQ